MLTDVDVELGAPGIYIAPKGIFIAWLSIAVRTRNFVICR